MSDKNLCKKTQLNKQSSLRWAFLLPKIRIPSIVTGGVMRFSDVNLADEALNLEKNNGF